MTFDLKNYLKSQLNIYTVIKHSFSSKFKSTCKRADTFFCLPLLFTFATSFPLSRRSIVQDNSSSGQQGTTESTYSTESTLHFVVLIVYFFVFFKCLFYHIKNQFFCCRRYWGFIFIALILMLSYQNA